ncbi:MAG: cupredoxin family copper-binding protein [Gammaproteobacteria bacterium]
MLVMALLANAVAQVGVWAAQPAQTVEIKDFAFRPEMIIVRAGATVVWRNQDIVPHTATAQDASWDTGEIARSADQALRFEYPGRYAYRCRFHPAMHGVIEVKP